MEMLLLFMEIGISCGMAVDGTQDLVISIEVDKSDEKTMHMF